MNLNLKLIKLKFINVTKSETSYLYLMVTPINL